jgi:hypothetical protein
MSITLFFEKVQNKLWAKLVQYTRKTVFYPFIYASYWHLLLGRKEIQSKEFCYYTAQPNVGAGIGHQMANWIAGYWFSQQFELPFAHIPFSSSKWESFLGFGEGEKVVEDLLKKGFKMVKLPLFDEYNKAELVFNKKIMASYSNQKVVFVAEQDQFYGDQFGVMEVIKEKFHTAPARMKDQLIFDTESFNIAIHVRRGDIVIGQENKNPNLLMRWQGNDYFEKVLRKTIEVIKTEKPIAIYLFSQGEKKDFTEFKSFENLHYCLDMNAQDSFLHMVMADLLITSKSSFSYKPALLSNGIKICPQNFWHSYPLTDDFILADDYGSFDNTKLIMKSYE